MKPFLIDTTLRDGEQAPGVVFSKKEKFEIASILNEIGVNELELGTPAIGKDEKQTIREISTYGFSFRTSSWCRATINDIKEAAGLGTSSINISLPVSDIQIYTLGKSRDWVLEQLKCTTRYASNYFEYVTVGAQDATRADVNYLIEYIAIAFENGASRVRIADTVGLSSPIDLQELFTTLKSHFPFREFEFHGHNDLGMATANSITAFRSGAKCISATVNGLGERAGNCVLEELIAYFMYKENYRSYRSEKIHELCNYVSKASRQVLSDNKPLIGSKVFTHESGIHTSAILKNRSAYQFIEPKDFGINNMGTQFCYGKHSGKASLEHFFKTNNLSVDDSQLIMVLDALKKSAFNLKRPISEQEVMAIYQSSLIS